MTGNKKKVDAEEAKRLALEDRADLFDNYFLPTVKLLEESLVSKDTEKVEQSLAKLIHLKEQIDEENEVIRQVPVELEHRKIQRKWEMELFDLFSPLKRKAEEFLKALQQQEAAKESASTNTTQGKQNVSKIQLPQLTLKTFKGDVLEWQPWYESFCSSIHDNPGLDDTQKFNFLVHFTAGEAAEEIKGFSRIGRLYGKAFKALQDRFGKEDVIVASHYAAFTSLPAIADLTDVSGLRKLYSGAMMNIRCLESLGVEESTYRDVLKQILLPKVPADITVSWCKTKDHSQKSVITFLGYLKTELEGRETAAMLRQTLKPNKQQHSSSSSKSREHDGHKGSTASALAAQVAGPPPATSSSTEPVEHRSSGRGKATAGQKNKYPCVFCKGDHFPIQCKLSTEKKWEVVKKEGRCHICLRDNHMKKDCKAEKKCKECPGLHHTALHSVKKTSAAASSSSDSTSGSAKPTPTPAAASTSASVIARQAYLLANPSRSKHIFLMTATIWIENGKGLRREAMCLIDGGSQRTYIRRSFALENGLITVGTEILVIQALGSSEPGEAKERNRWSIIIRGMFPNARGIAMTVVEDDDICPAPEYKRTKFAQELHDSGNHLAYSRFFDEDPKERMVDILIGSEHYYSIIEDHTRRSSSEGFRAVPSKLGWLLHGPSPVEPSKKFSSTNTAFISSMDLPDIEELDECLAKPAPTPVFITMSATTTPVETTGVQIKKNVSSNDSCSECRHLFWKMDSMGVNVQEEEFGQADPLAHYPSTIRKSKDGRWVAPLPWNEKKSTLRPNKEMAFKRLQSQLNQLRKSPHHLDTYHQQIQEAVKAGFVSKANMDYKGIHTYLPHHAVIKPDRTTTKVRPVFDGSAKTKYSPSINDCLYNGTNNTPELLAVLLRFRVPTIVWTADIEKAFHQVELAAEDAEVIRFMWVEDPSDPNSPVVYYVWKRLPFGLICSPYILRAVIELLLDEFDSIYPSTVAHLRSNLYVDDVIGGASSPELALQSIKEIQDIFSSAHMTVRKWTTSDKEVQQILGDDTGSPTGALGKALSGIQSPKVLGLNWDSKEDVFQFQPDKIIDAATKVGARPTKRQVSQLVARIFDPLGQIAPVLLIAKLIFSQIWASNIGWDDFIPETIAIEWTKFIETLPALSSLKIPRRIVAEGGSAAHAELHVFGDASERAFGAVAYLRTVTVNGNVKVAMITSKTRVAPPPPRNLTIPRLELLAAQLAATLADYIHDTFKAANLRTVMWSDSTITLAWIKGKKERRVFVQNRVNDIRKKTDPICWHHCPGEMNPADLASRGMTAEELVSSTLWWNPVWLSQPNPTLLYQWEPPSEEILNDAETVAERRNKKPKKPKKSAVTICSAAVVLPVGPPPPAIVSSELLTEFSSRFSNFEKLCRITAFLLRYIKRSRNRKQEPLPEGEQEPLPEGEQEPLPEATQEVKVKGNVIKIPCLSALELEEARNFWVAQIQRDAHPEEYNDLSKGRTVRKSSDLADLRPIWDAKARLIRVTGRTQPALDAQQIQPPILLPLSVERKNARGNPSGRRALLDLIIQDSHRRVLHFGLRTTLAELREHYHCVRGRQMVKRVLDRCVICKKNQSTHFDAPAAHLPEDRSSESNPFERTGVDFAGPLFVKPRYDPGNPDLVKCYLCLFTCATTRAIHLELVEDLTTRQFLLAIRRFFAIRGSASVIYSDNARTFKLAANYFHTLERDGSLQDFLADRRISWRFSANLAPWWGGFWERMVRTTKDSLRKTIGTAKLSFSELETTLAEVSFAINSRPLTYITDGGDGDSLPLTPFNLITGHRPSAKGRAIDRLEPEPMPGRDALIKRELRRRRALEKWRSSFRTDYLKELKQFQAPGKEKRSIRLGEIVLVHDANHKRMQWPLAVVTELIPGNDSIVRMVRLRTSKGLDTNRPIQRLYPLEVTAADPSLVHHPPPEDKEDPANSEPTVPEDLSVVQPPNGTDPDPAAEAPQYVGTLSQQKRKKKASAPDPEPRTVVTRTGRVSRPRQRLDL